MQRTTCVQRIQGGKIIASSRKQLPHFSRCHIFHLIVRNLIYSRIKSIDREKCGKDLCWRVEGSTTDEEWNVLGKGKENSKRRMASSALRSTRRWLILEQKVKIEVGWTTVGLSIVTNFSLKLIKPTPIILSTRKIGSWIDSATISTCLLTIVVLVSEYVAAVDTKALIKIDGETACIRIWCFFLQYWEALIGMWTRVRIVASLAPTVVN